jgi:hypothetical protein
MTRPLTLPTIWASGAAAKAGRYWATVPPSITSSLPVM